MGKMEPQAAAGTPGLMLTVQADGLKWPEMPVFASKEEERTHRKQRLAASFRIYANDGTTCGLQGTCDQGSGDLSFDNKTFSAGQTVVINTLTLTDGNA